MPGAILGTREAHGEWDREGLALVGFIAGHMHVQLPEEGGLEGGEVGCWTVDETQGQVSLPSCHPVGPL